MYVWSGVRVCMCVIFRCELTRSLCCVVPCRSIMWVCVEPNPPVLRSHHTVPELSCAVLHKRVPARDRQEIHVEFTAAEGDVDVLVATDTASRGLDTVQVCITAHMSSMWQGSVFPVPAHLIGWIDSVLVSVCGGGAGCCVLHR